MGYWDDHKMVSLTIRCNMGVSMLTTQVTVSTYIKMARTAIYNMMNVMNVN